LNLFAHGSPFAAEHRRFLRNRRPHRASHGRDSGGRRLLRFTVPLDLLQFHGNEPAELCASFGRPYIKAVPVKPGVDLLQYAARYGDAHGLLFDAFEPGGLPGGTGKTFDWNELPAELQRPLILSGGLTPQNVGAAIRIARPWAADVSSGVELTGEDGRPRKGIKSAAKIAAFIREVRNADE
jgi:phosphoribosylanthranilate isomerase